MKVTVEAFGTLVQPNEEDVERECRPGVGEDACVYLVESSSARHRNCTCSSHPVGYACKYNQWQWCFGLSERLPTMVAQRKGCQRVIDWHQTPGNITGKTGQTFDIP